MCISVIIMSKRASKLTKWLPLLIASVLGMCMAVISCNKSGADEEAAKPAEKTSPLKVLYVTHEPGKYHKYTPQKKVFTEIGAAQKWDVTVITGTHDEVIAKLSATPDFADGYDVVVYNFCFARCADLNVPYNIITQTKEKGIPALLIHCSLHSFMPTYKENGKHAVHIEGQPAIVKARKNLVEEWNKQHPDKVFPSWPTFTGISSSRHGPRAPIQVKKVKGDHPILKDVPEYETAVGELYNNYTTAEDSKATTSILKGEQKKASSIILWEHPVGDSKVVSFTLGHGTEEWGQAPFQKILINSVDYLSKLPKVEKK